MQLSQNVITFQFFMLWFGRTNQKARNVQVIKCVLITQAIYTEKEKKISRERKKLLPISYLYSCRTEDFNNRSNVFC